MAKIMQFAASSVREGVIPDSGHWIGGKSDRNDLHGASLPRCEYITEPEARRVAGALLPEAPMFGNKFGE